MKNKLPDLPANWPHIEGALEAILEVGGGQPGLVRLAMMVVEYINAKDACSAPRFAPDAATCFERLGAAEAALRTVREVTARAAGKAVL